MALNKHAGQALASKIGIAEQLTEAMRSPTLVPEKPERDGRATSPRGRKVDKVVDANTQVLKNRPGVGGRVVPTRAVTLTIPVQMYQSLVARAAKRTVEEGRVFNVQDIILSDIQVRHG